MKKIFLNFVESKQLLQIIALESNNMTEPSSQTNTIEQKTSASSEAPASYVKLAMRNMVRKGGTSLKHFAITTITLLGILVGLAYITR